MFLISQDKAKVFDMTDIKGYFIYTADSGYFPSEGEKEKECSLWANTQWKNPNANDCNQWRIGIFENFSVAEKVRNKLLSISPNDKGKVVICDNGVEILDWI